MLTLYFSPGASSMAPHIALHETGAAFEARPISLGRKEQRYAAFLAINPEGKVPALLIDGRVLTEVAGIMFYVARRFPEARLLPDDIEEQAQVVSWMSFIASSVHPARRQGIEAVHAIWPIVQQKLGGREWVVGRYSIADIHLFRLFWRVSKAMGLTREAYPDLYAHHDRMMQRPAVQKTIEIESALGYELPG